MAVPLLENATWERMVRAVEKVRERCDRATKALDAGGVAYAVIGGNAVANWVATVDEGAVRNTRDVDILIRRADLEAAKAAMTAAGFVFDNAYGVDFFLDGPGGKPSEGVHLLYAAEKVKETDPVPAPDIGEAERAPAFRVLALEALVRMKLVAYRDKDRTHIRDLIGVGLLDPTWVARYPAELAARLQAIFDTPGG
ncbi:MAG: hypothetical protein K2X87_01230 [Gemmataceae bacterium]|nr:hypothetical protein [Gemmataceae bacterium]